MTTSIGDRSLDARRSRMAKHAVSARANRRDPEDDALLDERRIVVGQKDQHRSIWDAIKHGHVIQRGLENSAVSEILLRSNPLVVGAASAGGFLVMACTPATGLSVARMRRQVVRGRLLV